MAARTFGFPGRSGSRVRRSGARSRPQGRPGGRSGDDRGERKRLGRLDRHHEDVPRQSSSGYSIASLLKPTRAAGALANLLTTSGNQALDGQGTTTRDLTLTTTLSARVTDVLPNGYLVLEGSKSVVVNSETHVVTVRGVARPLDITTENQILSNNLAQMEVRINGKGVVNDAIRRPFILYRLLMGLLPF